MRAPASSRYCVNPSFSLSVSRTPVRSSPKEITFSKSFHFATLKRLVVVVEPNAAQPKERSRAHWLLLTLIDFCFFDFVFLFFRSWGLCVCGGHEDLLTETILIII